MKYRDQPPKLEEQSVVDPCGQNTAYKSPKTAPDLNTPNAVKF